MLDTLASRSDQLELPDILSVLLSLSLPDRNIVQAHSTERRDQSHSASSPVNLFENWAKTVIGTSTQAHQNGSGVRWARLLSERWDAAALLAIAEPKMIVLIGPLLGPADSTSGSVPSAEHYYRAAALLEIIIAIGSDQSVTIPVQLANTVIATVPCLLCGCNTYKEDSVCLRSAISILRSFPRQIFLPVLENVCAECNDATSMQLLLYLALHCSPLTSCAASRY